MSEVLVTGGSGFVAGHVILGLLEAGHRVRTTVRNAAGEAAVGEALRVGGRGPDDAPRFFHADLTSDRGWDEAAAGCDHVMHVASPFPGAAPADENDLIVPARDGTLRVLRAARDAGVKRVVFTSSFAAVGYGRRSGGDLLTEEDWTPVDAPNPPYIKSKTVAERAAWDFVKREGGGLELSVLNPTGVFGPVLGSKLSSSIKIIKSMLDGEMPGLPDIHFGVVDVRDLADAHLRAMTTPAAAGERFICVSGPSLSLADVADILRRNLGDAAARVPTARIASWKIRLAALFGGRAAEVAGNLGKRRDADNAKAIRLLGWTPRSSEEAIVATARSLARLGLTRGA